MFEVEGQAEQVRERGAILCKCARIGIQQKGKHENCTLMRDIFFFIRLGFKACHHRHCAFNLVDRSQHTRAKSLTLEATIHLHFYL